MGAPLSNFMWFFRDRDFSYKGFNFLYYPNNYCGLWLFHQIRMCSYVIVPKFPWGSQIFLKADEGSSVLCNCQVRKLLKVKPKQYYHPRVERIFFFFLEKNWFHCSLIFGTKPCNLLPKPFLSSIKWTNEKLAFQACVLTVTVSSVKKSARRRFSSTWH